MKETLKDKINYEVNYFYVTEEGNYYENYLLDDIRKLYNPFNKFFN